MDHNDELELDPLFDLDDEIEESSPSVEEPGGFSRRQFMMRSATGALGVIATGAASAANNKSATPKIDKELKVGSKRPNIILIITDQERAPMHWPENWAETNLPNRKRLADRGVTFNRAFCNSAMCSPSRATLFTGLYPTQHGVEHTLSVGGSLSQEEPTLLTTTQNMAKMLGSAGYNVQYRGKWHLSKDVTHLTDVIGKEELEEFGFYGWEGPDGGQDAKAEHFGGGAPAFDKRWAQQAAEFLQSKDAKKGQPFALIVSFVNPHDVLAYPDSWDLQVGSSRTGYSNNYGDVAPECFNQGIPLPPTINESLLHNYKPTAQAQSLVFIGAGLGPLTEQQQRNYVNFYAYLQKEVDQHIGTVLDALESDKSLYKKTIVIRISDHGEMGLSHGGLRQKMFNAYEETLRVPLVISNPKYFPKGVRTEAMASLIDIMPTLATLCRVPNREQWDFRGKDLTPVILDAMKNPTNPTATVQEEILFTYDDDNPSRPDPQPFVTQPNHMRTIRTERYKYSVYFDPCGNEPNQYELYDLQYDPNELHNIANPENTLYYDAALVSDMHIKLLGKMNEVGVNFQPGSPYCPVPEPV